MAKITINTPITNLQSHNYYTDGIDPTATSWFLQDDDTGTVFGEVTGSSFTYGSYSNDPTAGTIESISYISDDGSRAWNISGLSLSADNYDWYLNNAIATGNAFTDYLVNQVLSGNDTIIGSSGNDSIVYSKGKDYIDAGSGVDTINFGEVSKVVNVNLTSEKYTVDSISSTIKNVENVIGGSAADTIIGNSSNNVIHGGQGSDTINGAAGNDTIYGDSGNNTLNGGDGNDIIVVAVTRYHDNAVNGGNGTDTVKFISSTTGLDINLDMGQAVELNDKYPDFIFTLAEVENVIGTSFNDKIVGDSGNNVINGGAGNDSIDGGAGLDMADYSTSYKAVNVNLVSGVVTGYGADKLSNIEGVIGSNFNDIIKGNSANNTIKSGNGADIIFADAGNDFIDGGSGVDTLNLSTVSSGMSIDLSLTTSQNTGGSGTDKIISIENLVGSKFVDKLLGNASANYIEAGAGNDSINGANGNDSIVGGLGADRMTGGHGIDKFIFKSSSDSLTKSQDTITDFVSGIDKIVFNEIDANTTIAGNQDFSLISSSANFSGAGQIKFSNGVLSGDTNGDGAADFGIIFSGVTTLTATDFIL